MSTLNFLQAHQTNALVKIEDELREAVRVQAHGGEDELRRTLSKMIAHVAEFCELLKGPREAMSELGIAFRSEARAFEADDRGAASFSETIREELHLPRISTPRVDSYAGGHAAPGAAPARDALRGSLHVVSSSLPPPPPPSAVDRASPMIQTPTLEVHGYSDTDSLPSSPLPLFVPPPQTPASEEWVKEWTSRTSVTASEARTPAPPPPSAVEWVGHSLW